MIAKVCLFSALVAVVVAGATAPAASLSDPEASPGQLVRLPDARHLNFRCSGTGRPTIVFENGFGATSLAWYKVRPLLDRRYRMCAYDRAGSGFSDTGPMPRDGATIARDLDAGLKAAGIAGPLVIVGHSAGGLYARIFADLRPRTVVAMVLVDPSIEFQDARLAARFGRGSGSLQPQIDKARRCLAAAQANALPSSDPALMTCAPKVNGSSQAQAARLAEARRPYTWQTQISELETLWTATSMEVAHGRCSYGRMPLIVLTADGAYAHAPEPIRAELDGFWTDVHREIARRSLRGKEVRVAGSSHLMMLDRPDAIASAVQDVVAQAGTQ